MEGQEGEERAGEKVGEGRGIPPANENPGYGPATSSISTCAIISEYIAGCCR